MTLSDIGSIASIIGLLISLFLVVKVYHLHIQIGKIHFDNSQDNQINTSFFSLFSSQKNKK